MSGPFRTVLGWPFVIAWSSHRTMWLSFCLCLCFQAQFCLSSANAMVDVTKNDIDYSNINTSSINTSSHSHSISVIHISLEAVREPLIFTVVVLLAGLSKIGFHHADLLSSKVPESCVLIVLGTVFGAILHFSNLSKTLPQLFNPHQFFIFLLPPIILESAFSLYDRTFAENIGSVLLFAVIGTILACFLLGLTLYGLMLCGAMGSIASISLVQILVFASIIVAVDPVAVLAVFNEVGVNHVLYFIVFGESLLNDGVTVVLYKVMQAFNLMNPIEGEQIVLGIVKFFVVCVGGLIIGILAGLITSILTRFTVHVRVVQPLVIYMMAYLSFLLSEMIEVSGIICIIGCGLIQRHYAFQNISSKSFITIKYFTKVLASANEIIIFLFLGLSLVHDEHVWHTGFVLWTLVLCLLYRFIIVFGMASLINRFDTMRVRLIGYDEMFMIAYGGLRGAVAFALVILLNENEIPMKKMFVTTTHAVIVFTVFIQGISIKPLVTLLSIRLAPEKNRSMYCELNSHVTDHMMAGIENLVGMRGRNYLREKLDRLDNAYIKRWMVNDPDPADSELQDFYEKIVIKEHYKYLRLVGAASIPSQPELPHIDTYLYLNKLDNHSKKLRDIRSASLGDEDTEKVGPPVTMRKRRHLSSPSKIVNDARGLRSLLISQHNSRLLLHTNYDKNLTTEDINNLGYGIQTKSARTRQLQRMMSESRPPFVHRASWADSDAQICQERSTQETVPKGKHGSTRRAQTLDLGSAFVGSLDFSSTPSSPLDAVFEVDENEKDFGEANQNNKSRGEKSPLLDNTPPLDETISRGVPTGQSRKRLLRQDDIKMDDLNGTNDSDDIV